MGTQSRVMLKRRICFPRCSTASVRIKENTPAAIAKAAILREGGSEKNSDTIATYKKNAIRSHSHRRSRISTNGKPNKSAAVHTGRWYTLKQQSFDSRTKGGP